VDKTVKQRRNIMEVTKVNNEDGLTLKITGSIDTRTAPTLEAELVSVLDDSKNTILDFSNVEYISSAGLRVLLMGHKKAKADNGKLSIANVPSFVMEIFDVTGFNNTLDFI